MNSISLAAFSIKIKDKTNHKYLDLNEVLPSKDLLNIVEAFFELLAKQFSDDSDNKKFLKVIYENYKKNNREISGDIQTGEYGFENDIVDKDDGVIKFKKKVQHVELKPLYFLIILPKDKSTGLLLLQRVGNSGIAEAFISAFKKYLKIELQNHFIEIELIVTDKILQQFLKGGEIKKITFKKFQVPSDLTDYFEKGELDEKLGHVEYSLVAGRDSSLTLGDRLNKLLFGDGSVSKLLSVRNFNYDRTIVKVKMGENLRTIDLGNHLKFRAYYDITSEIKIGKNGHPTYESISKAGDKLKNDILNLLYPKQNVS